MAKRVLDEERRKLLLGRMPFSPEHTTEFEPKGFEDLPDDMKPVFIVRSLTTSEKKDFPKLYDEKNTSMERDQVDFLCKVVKGWRNMFDAATGEEIEYQANSESMEKIHPSVVTEMLMFILKISGATPFEKEH